MKGWNVTQSIGLLLGLFGCFMLFRNQVEGLSLIMISCVLLIVPFVILKNYLLAAVCSAALALTAHVGWNGQKAISVAEAANQQTFNMKNPAGVLTQPTGGAAGATSVSKLKLLNPQTPVTITMALHDPIDLDGKTRDEVLALRRNAVNEYPALVSPLYIPSLNLYGGITDGKPWWGLTGTYFYGSGPHAADGLSEESRFLLNPYILVGLSEVYSYKLGANPPSEAQPFWADPRWLVWMPAQKQAYITYSLVRYFSMIKSRCPQCVDNARNLFLATTNAQDFGFTHMVIEPSTQVSAVFNTAFPIEQFIHTGGSCGMSGGCNNSSPMSQNYVLNINNLPADVTFRLYDHAPANAQEPPQFTFHMKIID